MPDKHRTSISLPIDVFKAGRKMAVDDDQDFSSWLETLIRAECFRRQPPDARDRTIMDPNLWDSLQSPARTLVDQGVGYAVGEPATEEIAP